MSVDLSKLRQRLWRAQAGMAQPLRRLLRSEPVVQGSFYLLRRKCGKPRCRCVSGHLHESWVLTRSEMGKHRLYSVPKEERLFVRQAAAEYRRGLRARSLLLKRQAAVLALADEMLQRRLVVWPRSKTEPPP